MKRQFRFILGISFLLISFVFAIKIINAISSPYAPGETLAPACAPGDVNCTVDTKILGDYTGGDYSYFEDDGTLVFNGDATVWDDLRVPISATTDAGSSPPEFALYCNSAIGGIQSSLYFNNLDEYLEISHNAVFDFPANNGSYSFELWLNPDLDSLSNGTIIQKAGAFQVKIIDNTFLEFTLSTSDGDKVLTADLLTLGAKNHIVVLVDSDGIDSSVSVYLNNVLGMNQTYLAAIPLTTVSDINMAVCEKVDGVQECLTALVDELRFYDLVLTTTDIFNHYNSGAGENGLPSESGLVAAYHFNDASGTVADNYEGTAILDATLYNTPSWATALVGSGSSRGIYTYFFDPDVLQEVHFTAQLPHSWKLGTDLHPHFHWSPEDSSAGDVLWGLECGIMDVGSQFVNSVLLTSTDEITAAGNIIHEHSYTDFTPFDMSVYTNSNDVSIILICRAFRDAADVLDTYPSRAALLEIDFHYEIDTIGSRSELAK